MLGTLRDDQKDDWDQFVNELVQAYNNTPHPSTGLTPYFLMCRLAYKITDGFGAGLGGGIFKWLHIQVQKSPAKEGFTFTAQRGTLLTGQRVMVLNKRTRGQGKLEDKWEQNTYTVSCQPNVDVTVYVVNK